MNHEYEICNVSGCAYFKCNLCGELIALNQPTSYEEGEETYSNLVRMHEHK